MYRRTLRAVTSHMSGPAMQTVTTLLVLLFGAWLLANGVTVSGRTLLPGAGGMPTMTPALFHPQDGAGLGSLLRFCAYLFLAAIAAWLTLRIAAAFFLARQAGYSPSARMLWFLRLAPVRGAGATLGTFVVTAGAGTAHAASPQVGHVASRSAIVSVQHAAEVTKSESDARVTRQALPAAQITQVKGTKQAVKSVTAFLYTVNAGDTLGQLSESFYGTPNRYMDIFRASKGLQQNDGTYMTNPNLLTVGWQVRIPLPAQNLVVEGDHLLKIVQPGDTASGIAQQYLGDWSRYREIIAASREITQPDGEPPLAGSGSLIFPGMVLELPMSSLVTTYNAPAKQTLQVKKGKAYAQVHALRTAKAAVKTAPVHPLAGAKAPVVAPAVQQPTAAETAAKTAAEGTFVRHIAVRRKVQAVVPVAAPARPAASRSARPTTLTGRPTVRAPFSPIIIPTFLIALALMAAGAVAMRRRRGSALLTPLGMGRISETMKRVMHKAQSGIPTPTVRAMQQQVSGQEGHRVAFVLAALQQAGGSLGMGIETVRTVVERTDGIDMSLAVRGIDAARRTRLADALGRRLGVAVGLQPGVDSDGTPVMTLSVAQGPIPRAASPRPSPAPLVLPVGRVSAGDLVYVNIAQSESLLIAGDDPQAPAGLVRLLVTSLVMQSSPEQVQLLVATGDTMMRSALAATPFLMQPAVDPANTSELAQLVAQADAISMDRFTADEDTASQPYIVVVLDGIEDIAHIPQLCENLQALCRQGRDSRIHVIATTTSPRALVDSGILDLFRTRLAYHLDPSQSQEFFGDELIASELVGNEMHLHGLGPDQTLTALPLDGTIMEELIAQDAVQRMPSTANEITREYAAIAETQKEADPWASVVAAEPVGASVSLAQENASAYEDETRWGDDEQEEQDSDNVAVFTAGHPQDIVTGKPDWEDQKPVSLPPAWAQNEPNLSWSTRGTHPEPLTETQKLRDDAIREALAPVDSQARLEIRLMNGVQIYMDGKPMTTTFREQPIIILGIIGLLGPGPVSAETIIDRLAQQGPPHVHRNAKTIARAISRLREHLQAQGLKENPVVWSNAGGYELADGVATCDLFNMVKLKERMNTVDREDRHLLWERFVDLYRGDIWTYNNRPNWVTAYAERWRKDYINYLYRLANWHVEFGNDPNEAMDRAIQLFNEEPGEERNAILMIDLLGSKGDLSGLEDFYQRLRHERQQDGDGEPSDSEQNHYNRWKQRMIETA